MVLDERRTAPLRRAIRRVVRPGDVVVDLGAGIGLLTFEALAQGARRVYAIEVEGQSLHVARWLAKRSGLSSKIGFFPDHSFNIDLPEKADVLISETIGAAAFDENFLATLIDAKKRFLKRGGRIIPSCVELWGELPNRSKPNCLAKVGTKRWRSAELKVTHKFLAKRGGKLGGVRLWPKIYWTERDKTNASPHLGPTHWGETILGVGQRQIQKGQILTLNFAIRPDPGRPMWKTEIIWQLH